MLFRAKSKPVFSVRMATVTVKRKTRRGRRKGHRLNSGKRSVFIPRRSWFQKGDKTMINFGEGMSSFNGTSGECPISNQMENNTACENFEGCEFFYSHWWNCTPFKKTQKLVRPPYMPIAPNNSTQYIIENHFEIEFDKAARDEVEENIRTDNFEQWDGEKNSTSIQQLAVSDVPRVDHRTKLKPLSGFAHNKLCSNEALEETVRQGHEKGSRLLEVDCDYESLSDSDFFEFVQTDFLQAYEELQKEKLLKLTKSELIVEVMKLERKLDELQRKEELQNLT